MDDEYVAVPLTEEEQEEANERRRKLRENAQPIRKSRLSIITIILSLVFLIAAAAFFTFFMAPNDVVERYPNTKALYDALGIRLKVDKNAPPKVTIKPYTTRMVAVGDDYKLTVSGHIVNEGMGQVTIPGIIGTLIDDEGDRIYEWMFCLPNRKLVAGQGIDYSYDVMAAPSNTSVAVIKIKWEYDAQGNLIDTCADMEPAP